MKLIKGDHIKIVSGKNKGQEGTVEQVFAKLDKVLIPGVNEYKKHVKARNANQKSEIKIITKPLPLAAVALICPKCKKQTRVGYVMEKDKKVRICKKCSAKI